MLPREARIVIDKHGSITALIILSDIIMGTIKMSLSGNNTDICSMKDIFCAIRYLKAARV